MPQLSLDQLLSNKKSSPVILINDSIQLSALPILREITKRTVDNQHHVISLLTETSPTAWLESLGSSLDRSKVHIIDAYSDPQGWESEEPIVHEKDTQGCGSLTRLTRVSDFERLVLPVVMEWTQKAPGCLILVDALNPLTQLSSYRTYRFVKALESLTTDTIRVAVGYHMDIRPIAQEYPPFSDSLNRLASVIITLNQLKPPTAQTESQARLTGFVAQDTFSYLHITSNHVGRGGVAKVEWRRKSGKVLYETNGFYVDKGELMVVPASQLGVDEKADDEEDMEEVKEATKTVDPTANLSFNLSLTDEQRKTKENLVLPHFKAQQVEIDGTSSSNSAGGSIYYEPDAADDFDDEDPDDDLDI